MGRKGRIAAAVGAVALLLSGAVLGLLAFRSLRTRAAVYRVAVRAVPPTTTSWWMPDEEPCPTGGRGEGPPPAEQSASISPVGGAGSQAVGPGQILVYELVIDSATTAPTKGDLTTSLAFDQPSKSLAFNPAGVVCAFVDVGDPATTSLTSRATATALPAGEDKAVRSDVLLTGLEAESTAVVELWVKAAAELDRNTAAFPSRIVGVTAPAGRSAQVMVNSARTTRSTSTDRTSIKLDLSLQNEAPPQPGGPIQYRMLITNTSPDALATQLVAEAAPDATVTVSNVTVRDTAGVPTTCTRDTAEVTCSAGYLIPGEVVTVDVNGTLAADTPTLFQGTGTSCRKQGQDVCLSAKIVALGGSQSSSRPVELASDLPSKDTLGLSKLAPQATGALYVGDYADFVYVVSPGTAAATDVAVVDPACGPIILVSGDDGADNVLSPGERWTYRCSAIVDRSQASDVTVTASTPGGEPIGTTTRLATPILDPSIEIRAPENADRPTLEVLNSGDTDLAEVAVQGRGCRPAEKSGDAEADGVLAPGERWMFTCDQRTGTVRAYATDLAGGAVTAGLVG